MYYRLLKESELRDIFDETSLKVLKYFLLKTSLSIPEENIQAINNNTNFKISKEFYETWVCQAINAKSVGAGSFPIDIISNDFNFCADIKSVTFDYKKKLPTSLSGEASLCQNFKEEASFNIDSYFNNNDFIALISKWEEIFQNKMNLDKHSVITNHLKPNYKTYSFWFVQSSCSSFLEIIGFEYNKNAELSVKKSSKKSIWINGMCDPNIADIKLFKSKRRIEKRLKINNINEKIKIDIPKFFPKNNLREELSNLNNDDIPQLLMNKIQNNLV